MEHHDNNCTRSSTETAAALAGENAAVGSGPGLPPEALAPCLADLKRQIALRLAMP